jgi:hypothetical protein
LRRQRGQPGASPGGSGPGIDLSGGLRRDPGGVGAIRGLVVGRPGRLYSARRVPPGTGWSSASFHVCFRPGRTHGGRRSDTADYQPGKPASSGRRTLESVLKYTCLITAPGSVVAALAGCAHELHFFYRGQRAHPTSLRSTRLRRPLPRAAPLMPPAPGQLPAFGPQLQCQKAMPGCDIQQ